MAMIPWWIHYPNVNNEIINLDWILQISNENTETIKNFIGVNTIKYADPILWDITSQYEANTIVVDPQTGDAYISTKAVPYGVALSNDGYWTRIYNYASEIHTFREQIAADEQLSTTATARRSIDDLVFLNGLLYRVTAPMIAGDSYVEGSNCVKTTVNAELLRLHTSISAEAEARAEADTALGGRIDDEAEARAEADTALGGRIDGEAQARADADTALGQRIDGEAQARADADTALGQRIDGEAQARADADNEIINMIASSSFKDRKWVFIGDSYGEGVNASDPSNPITAFYDYMIQWLNIPADHYYKSCVSGYGFARPNYTFLSLLQGLNIEDKDSITDIVVCGGPNDTPDAIWVNIESAITEFCNYCKTNFKNARIHIGMIGYNYEGSSSNYRLTRVFRLYLESAIKNGAEYLNNIENAIHATPYFQIDGHPNSDGQQLIALSLINCLKTGYATVCHQNQLQNIVTLDSAWVAADITTIFSCQHDNVIEFINNAFINISLNSNITITSREYSDYIKIGHLSNTHLIGGDFTFTTWCAPICMYLASGTNTGGIAEYHITDGDLYVRVYNTLSQTYVLHGLRICPFAATFPAKYC